MLDLQTNLWTELKEFGLSRPIAFHTLTFVSQKQIVLLGGAEDRWGNGEGASDLVMLYNTATSTWTESQRLPPNFYGEGTGLSSHKVVAVRKGKRVSKVICLGGYVFWNEVSSYLLEFQIKS